MKSVFFPSFIKGVLPWLKTLLGLSMPQEKQIFLKVDSVKIVHMSKFEPDEYVDGKEILKHFF